MDKPVVIYRAFNQLPDSTHTDENYYAFIDYLNK
jgi:hypothetical protein